MSHDEQETWIRQNVPTGEQQDEMLQSHEPRRLNRTVVLGASSEPRSGPHDRPLPRSPPPRSTPSPPPGPPHAIPRASPACRPRPSPPAQQATIARYGSWGAAPGVSDQRRADWHERRADLIDLLGEDGYAAARRTTVNAHSTDPAIAAPMWQAMTDLGFNQGTVL